MLIFKCWRQIILVDNATIDYPVVVQEYQHAFILMESTKINGKYQNIMTRIVVGCVTLEYLNFSYRAYSEQCRPRRSGHSRLKIFLVQIRDATNIRSQYNIQNNFSQYKFYHLACFVKWLSVHLRLFWTMDSLTIRQF